MKKEIIKAGNSLYNAGASLIGVVVISPLIGLFSSTQTNPETLKNILIVGALLNVVLLIYAGGSLLRAGKTLLNLDDSSED
jgi:hypothetical protein